MFSERWKFAYSILSSATRLKYAQKMCSYLRSDGIFVRRCRKRVRSPIISHHRPFIVINSISSTFIFSRDQCRCGNEQSKYLADEDTACDSNKCSGMETETCGGNNYVKMYRTTVQGMNSNLVYYFVSWNLSPNYFLLIIFS